jgi:hypothetical protein
MKRLILLFLITNMTAATLTGQVMMMFSSDSLVNITSPLDLDSLFYWFAADVGVTTNNNKVTQWNDLSGNGYHVTQADTSKAPTYSATGGPGSRPTLTFDGTDDFLASAAHFWGSDDLTVIVVMKFANATRNAQEVVIRKGESVGNNRQFYVMGQNSSNSFVIDFSVFKDGGAVNYVAYLFAQKYNTYKLQSCISDGAGVVTANIDGNTQSVTRSANGSGDDTIKNSSSSKTSIGVANPDGTPAAFLQGSISEIIVFSRALTTTERTAVENYLNKKYDLFYFIIFAFPIAGAKRRKLIPNQKKNAA